MRQRDRILEIARTQLGYKEGPNNDTKYGDWYGLPNNPWCQMFISWCADQAGIGTDIIPRTASCPTALEWFMKRDGRIGDIPAQPGGKGPPPGQPHRSRQQRNQQPQPLGRYKFNEHGNSPTIPMPAAPAIQSEAAFAG